MSLVVLDADVSRGVIEAEQGNIPIILVTIEGHNRITDEEEEQTLVLTLGNANMLGQVLITESLTHTDTETTDNQEDASE